ncbi:MAG: hypothetical protein O2878_00705 [Bacteroidetes bacterium]|nr:hypothetical protein [Bacteroidota bacterium]MDA0935626.1 hypothetical protein [Bacteroidota bacterium]
MKPTYFNLGFAWVVLLFACCQKTESNSATNNFFDIDGKKHSIEKAAFVKLEDNSTLNNMKALLFSSKGLSFDTDSNRELKIKGRGTLMGFIIYSQKNEDLVNGDHFINLRPPYKEGDVALGFYNLDWDEKNGLIHYEEDDGPLLLAGKVTVLQKQDLADLKFNFTTEDGKILKGHYLGTLQKNLIYKTDQIEFDD